MEVADRRGYLTLELETGKDGVLLLRYHDIDDHGDNDGHGDHDDYGDNDDGKISEPRAKNGKGHCPSPSFFNLFPSQTKFRLEFLIKCQNCYLNTISGNLYIQKKLVDFK